MGEGLADDLAHILGAGALASHFQPIALLDSGRVTGVEALARWRCEDGQVLTVEAVWSAAEALDARPALCAAMAAEAMRAFGAADWAGELELSVNAGCPDIAEVGFAPAFLAQASLHGIAPNRLWLEITEDAPLNDVGAVTRTLAHLRAAGVRVAVDDFGAGHATLSWLIALPLDGIKLDRAFAAAVDETGTPQTVTRHMIALAQELGLSFIAEGVETEGQRAALAAMGCRKGQGRLFGMPAARLSL